MPSGVALCLAAAGLTSVALVLLLRRRRRQQRCCEKFLSPFPPPALIISLSRFPAARKSVLKRCEEAGLTGARIFEAVDGRDLSSEELKSRGVVTYPSWRIEGSTFRCFDRELKWGEVWAAPLSHVGVGGARSRRQMPPAAISCSSTSSLALPSSCASPSTR